MGQMEFLLACQAVMGQDHVRHGIGTLGEKTLHAVLKTYFDPDPTHHEINIGPYVVDILGNDGFVEIQTSGLYRLREKLEFLLQHAPVTVVYPIPAVKWLIWLEKDGKVSPRRKSPKQPSAWELLPELYGLRGLLNREGLRFCAVLLELEEYRLKNGWSDDGKKGSTRFERLPIRLLDEVWLNCLDDYSALIPSVLSDPFKVKDFAKISRLSPRKAAAAVSVLCTVGALERIGKSGNAYLYTKTAISFSESYTGR